MTLPSWPFAFLYVWLRLAGVGMRRGEEEQKGLIWEAGPTVPLHFYLYFKINSEQKKCHIIMAFLGAGGDFPASWEAIVYSSGPFMGRSPIVLTAGG